MNKRVTYAGGKEAMQDGRMDVYTPLPTLPALKHLKKVSRNTTKITVKAVSIIVRTGGDNIW